MYLLVAHIDRYNYQHPQQKKQFQKRYIAECVIMSGDAHKHIQTVHENGIRS